MWTTSWTGVSPPGNAELSSSVEISRSSKLWWKRPKLRPDELSQSYEAQSCGQGSPQGLCRSSIKVFLSASLSTVEGPPVSNTVCNSSSAFFLGMHSFRLDSSAIMDRYSVTIIIQHPIPLRLGSLSITFTNEAANIINEASEISTKRYPRESTQQRESARFAQKFTIFAPGVWGAIVACMREPARESINR